MTHRQSKETALFELNKLIIENGGVECEQVPEIFFPEDEPADGTRHQGIALAKVICGNCPVSYECLEYALIAEEPFGIWGGMTPKNRQTILSARKPGWSKAKQ
jgi:WhiB family redox-sensing transcriptional regulator